MTGLLMIPSSRKETSLSTHHKHGLLMHTAAEYRATPAVTSATNSPCYHPSTQLKQKISTIKPHAAPPYTPLTP